MTYDFSNARALWLFQYSWHLTFPVFMTLDLSNMYGRKLFKDSGFFTYTIFIDFDFSSTHAWFANADFMLSNSSSHKSAENWLVVV